MPGWGGVEDKAVGMMISANESSEDMKMIRDGRREMTCGRLVIRGNNHLDRIICTGQNSLSIAGKNVDSPD